MKKVSCFFKCKILMVATLCVALVLNGTSAGAQTITTVAGRGAANDIAATSVSLFSVEGISTDGTGNLFIADGGNNRVRKISSGLITTIAGNQNMGSGGDGGAATAASITNPMAVVTDAAGNVYIAGGNRIRKVNTSGVISTIAGNGIGGFSGDGGQATAAAVNYPTALAIDASGNIYFSDNGNARVRRISASGIITTVAGNGTNGYSGDGAAATAAMISQPMGLCADGAGNIYVADYGNSRVRKISGGTITTVAGSAIAGFSGDGSAATLAKLSSPNDVTIDGSGNIYIADAGNNRVRKVNSSGTISTYAGSGTYGYAGDGMIATSGNLAYPTRVTVDASGNLYIADKNNSRIRKVNASWVMSTVAGGGVMDGYQATASLLNSPQKTAVDAAGNIYIADAGHYRVRKINTAGVITTIAGTGTQGTTGDGGNATAATLFYPDDIAVDAAGNVYISDFVKVRKISAAGIISTLAGTGSAGYNGDGIQATAAQVSQVQGVAVDASGNVYLADNVNARVRKVAPSGIISTVAGTGTTGFSGDGGPATAAQLWNPYGISVDASGNIYVADATNQRVRKIVPSGTITTVAGTGGTSISGEGGPATAAQIGGVRDVAVDASGNLYIHTLSKIQKVNAAGILSTVAGSGGGGFSGTGGPATAAAMTPTGVEIDNMGNIYITEANNNVVRMVAPAPLAIPSIASVSPNPANPGTSVTITGTNFNTTPANNIVYFGATRATVNTASATSLNVTVPVGATYMPVSVNNIASALTGYSQYPFLPKYDNSAYAPGSVNFSPKVDFSTGSGSNPYTVALSDIDGDGKSDLIAVTDPTANIVSIYRNISSSGSITTGSFASKVDFISGSGPSNIAMGDIDGDGKPDMVIANGNGSTSTISVFRNTSSVGSITTGSFASKVDFSTGSNPISVAIGDIDGDGKADIAVSNKGSNTFSVLRNTGSSGNITASSFAPKVDFVTGGQPTNIVIADIDGDGKPDIAVTNISSHTISVFRNTASSGSITTGSFAAKVDFATGTNPGFLAIGDIDGDGKPDIAVTNQSSATISVFHNTGSSGSMSASSFAAKVDFATGTTPRIVAIGDIDGDGKPDVTVAASVVSVFRNTSSVGAISTGSFAAKIDLASGAYYGVAIGDMDGDGKPDIAAVNNSSQNVSVLRNNPVAAITGTLTACPGTTTTLSNATAGGTWSSGNTSVAMVGTGSGLVTGIAAGTAVISYTVGGGSVTAVVTVNPLANAGTITGASSVNAGSTITLSNTVTGGSWSSSNTSVATVGTGGVVTGVAAGTVTISYTVSNGCGSVHATKVVSVNAAGTVLCEGWNNVGSAGFSAGGAKLTAIATDPGGIPYIAYQDVANGDRLTVKKYVDGIWVAVGSEGFSASAIHYPSIAITGTGIPYVSFTDGSVGAKASVMRFVGGTWEVVGTSGFSTCNAYYTSIAIDGDNKPYVAYRDNCAGKPFVMKYTGSAWVTVGGVSASDGNAIDVSLALDAATGFPYISYADVANSQKGTVRKFNGTTWETAGAAVFSADAVNQTSIRIKSGEPYVAYSDNSLVGKVTVKKYSGGAWVTVGSAGFSASIASYPSLAIGGSGTPYVAYRDAGNGYKATLMKYDGANWIAVGSAGFSEGGADYTALAVSGDGTPYVAYRDEANSGKATVMKFASSTLTPITGTATVCPGSTSALANITPGGTWSSSNTGVASVGTSTGIVTGVAAGTATISYVISGGCTTTKVVTVSPLPNAGTITGSASVNAGSTITLSNTVTGGSWSSSNTSVAIVGTGGVVTGVAAGTVTISYSVSNGCGSVSATKVVSVNAAGTVLCEGWNNVGSAGFSADRADYISFAIDGSGTPWIVYQDWANSNKATVMKYNGSTWVTVGVAGFSAGQAGHTSIAVDGVGTPYVAYSDGALSSKATVMKFNGSSWVNVGTPGFSTSLTEYNYLAIDGSGAPYLAYRDHGNGTKATVMKYNGSAWGTVGSAGFSAGSASGLSLIIDNSGMPCVAYTDGANSSKATVMKYTGSSWATVGVPGFSSGTVGYTSLAVDASGASYVAFSDYSNSQKATVMKYNGSVWIIVGSAGFSAGQAHYTSLAIDGSGTPMVGYYDVANGHKATAMKYTGSDWTVLGSPGVSAGSVAFTCLAIDASGTPHLAYRDGANGNKATVIKFTPAALAPITGTAAVCAGSTATLANTTPGGSWSSSNTGVASVGTSTGIVTGVAAGTATISYVISGGCVVTRVISVNATPSAIIGSSAVCLGASVTLNSWPAGGAWISSVPAVASVSSSGVVTGASLGTSRVTYTLPEGCFSTMTLTVNALPSVISGPGSFCVSACNTFSATPAGGFWISSTPSVASVSILAGNVCGVAAGTTTISYSVSGCVRTAVVTVNASGGGGSGSPVITTVAGTGVAGFSGDGGPATAAKLNYPAGISFDNAGNMYVKEQNNYRVRRISTTGIIQTIAGNGTYGYAGDGGPATAARLADGHHTAFDAAGNIYIADGNNYRIRRINTAGIISTFAGIGVDGSSGDGGPASAAKLDSRGSILIAPSGEMFIADMFNSRVRRINTDGIISTYAGGSGTLGDGGPATNARLMTPGGMVLDAAGNLYVADHSAHRVRKISSAGIITTYAGTGTEGYSGNNGPAIAAQLNTPISIAMDAEGNLYIGDQANYVIRKVAPSGIITTIAGTNTSGFSGDGGPATAASFASISDIKFDGAGNMFVADAPNNRVRRIGSPLLSISTANICVTGSTTLTSSIPGGTWTSGNTSVATVSSSGVVSGVAGGTATISYVITGTCTANVATAIVTVNPLPTAGTITGLSTVNVGANITLSNAVTGGAWSSSNTSVATVGTGGVVTGVATGTVTISYSVTNGCGTTSVVKSITVGTAVGTPITGTLSVCHGNVTTLAHATPGGVWTSANTSVAMVGSASGVVTGIMPGTATISYTISGTPVTAVVTVHALPAGYSVTGGGNYCTGSAGVSVGLSGSQSGVNYQLYKGSAATGGPVTGTGAEISFGPQAAAGTYTVQATNAATGCRSNMDGSAMVAASAAPTAYSVTGGGSYCAGGAGVSISLSGSQVGVVYQAYQGSSMAGGPVAGTGSAITFGLFVATGTYTVRAINTVTACEANMTGSATVSIGGLPNAGTITGAGSVCQAGSATLSNATPGGSWSSSNSAIVSVSASGIVTGNAEGSATISYTVSNSCGSASATKTVSVSIAPAPGAIMGASSLDAGGVITLSNSTPGGTWSSSVPAKASVSSSGVVTGILPGTTTITYTVINGCGSASATKVITVNAAEGAGIIGVLSLCDGGTTTLTNSVTGGTWSTGNMAVATISAGGVVSGITAGTAVISYITATTISTAVITVNALPGVISGATAVCIGESAMLTGGEGGTWSSSNPAAASVHMTTGLVTGLAAGTVAITFTSADGCARAHSMSINALPAPIGGTAAMCAGGSVTLTNTGSGTWSSGNTDVATVPAAPGVVTGVSAGTATITFRLTATGCAITRDVTVNALPASVSGPATLCVSGIASYSCTPPGGTWSAGGSSAITLDAVSGNATANSAGTLVITYSAGGCTATKPVTVSALPAIITGTFSVCVASTTTVASATAGGTWTSSNTSVAGAGSITSTSGFVNGLMPGTTTIRYTAGTGCSRTAVVTVTSAPAISGPDGLCVGGTVAFTAGTGGTWASSTPTVAAVSAAGAVTGVAAGPATITYRFTPTCLATKPISVTSGPADPISGPASVCTGATISLSHPVSGGAWSSSNTSRASVSPTGDVTGGASTGTVNITYTLDAGCFRIHTLTVAAPPAAITGTAVLCAGATTTLSCTTPGGAWACADADASVSSAGVVTGVSAGTAVVSYMSGAGCASTRVVTVNVTPEPITGSNPICVGAVQTYTTTPSGGTWGSSSSAIAPIGFTTGTVTGSGSGGVATISYTLPGGCKRSLVVTVNTLPGAITGGLTACAGSTTTLNAATAGLTWSSGAPAIASVSTLTSITGLVTGLTAGTAAISYTNAAGCSRAVVVTVSAGPAAIMGNDEICVGGTSALTNATPGGTWSSSTPAKGSVNAAGVVTGITVGTTTITYKLSASCMATRPVSVVSTPAAAITGPSTVCVGTSMSLTHPAMGGTWLSSNTGKATVSSTGLVSGVFPGSATITYYTGPGCYRTHAVTVYAAVPGISPIGGPAAICEGSVRLVNNATAGGTWSTGDAAIATVVASVNPATGQACGAATGVSDGTVTITYTNPGSGCYSLLQLTVNPIPDVITSTVEPLTLVAPATAMLNSATPGGTWLSSASGRASVGSSTGMVTAVAAGTATISYQLTATGCVRTRVVTVAASRPGGSVATAATVIAIYPSPTSGMLTVEAPVNGRFVILSIDNRKIAEYHTAAPSAAITLPYNLAAGMYMCRFEGEDGSTQVARIVYAP